MDNDDAIGTIAGGAGVIFGGRVLKIALLFSVQIFIARVLGSTGYGNVVLAAMTIGVGGLVAGLGIPRGLVRKLPYYEDDPPRARGILRAALLYDVVGGVTVGTGVFLLAPFVATEVFGDARLVVLLRVAAVGIPVAVLTKLALSTAKAGRTARPEVLVNHLVDPVGRAVLVGALVVAGYGALGATVGRVLAMAVAAVVALYLAYRSLRVSLGGATEPMYREMLGFGLPLMLASGVDFLIANTDTFLVGVFLTSSAVGVYNAVFQLRTAVQFFHHPFTHLLSPVLTRLDAEGDVGEARRTYRVVTKWVVLLTTPVFLAVFLFPRTAIRLSFGGQYLNGATALRVLAVPMMVTTLLGANERALVGLGHNRISLYVNAGVAVVNVGLNLVLIPRTGIVGAAIASAVAFVARDVVFTVALYRWEGLHPFSWATARPFLGGVALAAVGYPLLVRTVGVGVPAVVAAGVLYLILYAPAVVLLGAVEPADARILSLVEDSLGRRVPYVRRLVLAIEEFGV